VQSIFEELLQPSVSIAVADLECFGLDGFVDVDDAGPGGACHLLYGLCVLFCHFDQPIGRPVRVVAPFLIRRNDTSRLGDGRRRDEEDLYCGPKRSDRRDEGAEVVFEPVEGNVLRSGR
jgi:hypothetical protein